jgi:hypothetical protein
MCRTCPNCRVSAAQLRKLRQRSFDAMCLSCCCTPQDLAFVPTRSARAKPKPTLAVGPPSFGKADDQAAGEKLERLRE